ncbi:MAG: alpha/beta hydrolase [Bacteroidetes bacterium]|nr:MAG: alpha/beta hydrolase [Bacteroidota bacterium]
MYRLFTFFLLTLTLSLALTAQRRTLSPPFDNSQFSTVQGLKLHYRQWQPEGAVRGKVLLVHGFCGSTFSWRKTIPSLLAQGYAVTAVDLPPFGYSDRSPEINHSTSFQARLLWDFIRQIDPSGEKWVLIGHSMGAAVVGAMASYKPAFTASVVFTDGAMYSREAESTMFQRWVTGSGLVQGGAELAGDVYFFHYKRMSKLLAKAYSAEPDSEAVLGYLAPLKLAKTASGIFDMTAYSKPVFSYSESRVEVPTLVIWGEKDAVVPLEAGQKLHNKLPRSQMYVISGAGHCPMETHAEAYNRLIQAFLQETRSEAD